MIFALSDMIEGVGGPAVFRYITARALFAFLTAFLFGIYAGRPIINTLYERVSFLRACYGDIVLSQSPVRPSWVVLFFRSSLSLFYSGAASTIFAPGLAHMHAVFFWNRGL